MTVYKISKKYQTNVSSLHACFLELLITLKKIEQSQQKLGYIYYKISICYCLNTINKIFYFVIQKF